MHVNIASLVASRALHVIEAAIMHQHAVFANEVDVFGVNFEVEDGLRAGAGEFLGDGFGGAVQRQQPLTDLQRARLNVFLPVHGPERMIRRRADGVGGADGFQCSVFSVQGIAGGCKVVHAVTRRADAQPRAEDFITYDQINHVAAGVVEGCRDDLASVPVIRWRLNVRGKAEGRESFSVPPTGICPSRPPERDSRPFPLPDCGPTAYPFQ